MSASAEGIHHLKIPTSDVKPTDNVLGYGSYGKVFEVEYNGKLCAGKEVHPYMIEHANKEERAKVKGIFLRDCEVWSALRHPNLVQFLGIYYPSSDESGLPVMVMEKMQETMTSLVEKRDNIPLMVKLSILHDVSQGLSYLHSCNPAIVHRDLSSSKILLTSDLDAKITDYGLAKATMIEISKTITKSLNATAFLPPEALGTNLMKYGPPIDVFSFGGMILHISSRQWPVPKASKTGMNAGGRLVLSEVDRRQQYLDMMVGASSDLKPLAISCLADDPEKRPAAIEISEVLKKMKEDCRKKTDHDGMDAVAWLAEIKPPSLSNES
ncbi:uncharacterized protein [Dysidea avara]|uniref:uncharacterized protein n=1 Tax=Dysidea avara TaxID=196820 RepID=UPI00332B6674